MGEWIEEYFLLNVRPAFRDAAAHFRRSGAVFAVLLILQAMLCAVWLAARTETRAFEEATRADVSYHIVFSGLSRRAYNRLVNTTLAYRARAFGEYQVVDTVESGIGDELYYDVYVRLLPDRKRPQMLWPVYYSFLQQYEETLLADSPNAARMVSPRLYADAHWNLRTGLYALTSSFAQAGSKTVVNLFGEEVAKVKPPFLMLPGEESLHRAPRAYAAVFAILLLCGSALLGWLFFIHTDEFRHTYGVYAVFGADRKKLTSLSAWEMRAVGVMTLPPAAIAAYAAVWIVFGAAPPLSLRVPLGVGLLVFFVIRLTLGAALRSVSRRYAAQLLAAADNTHLVTSPRRSLRPGRRLGARFAAVGWLRFRKYSLRLAAAGAAVVLLASSMLYARNITDTAAGRRAPQFTITFRDAIPSDDYCDAVLPALREIDGIVRASARVSRSALSLSSHVRAASPAVRGSHWIDAGNGLSASLSFTYALFDENILTALDGCPLEGAPSVDASHAVLAVPSHLADTVTLASGDTVELAVLRGDTVRVGSMDSERRLLRRYLRGNEYDYAPLTLSAVAITDDADDFYTLYLAEETYLSFSRTSDAAMVGAHVIFSDVLRTSRLTDVSMLEEDALRALARQTTLPYTMDQADFSDGLDGYLSDALYGDSAMNERLCGTEHVIFVLADEATRAALKAAHPNANIDCLDRGRIVVSASGPDGKYLDLSTSKKGGDPILIGRPIGVQPDLDGAGDNLINEAILRSRYAYTTWHVGAVIDNGMDGIFLYLPPDAYTSLTRAQPYYTNVAIYADADLNARQERQLFARLRTVLTAAGGGTLVDTHAAFLRQARAESGVGAALTLGAAALLLMLTPCVFYSLRLFIGRRRTEADVRRTFGATEADVRRVFLREGLLDGALVFLADLALAAAVFLPSLAPLSVVTGLDVRPCVPVTALLPAAAAHALLTFLAFVRGTVRLRPPRRTAKKKAPEKEAAE